MIADLRSLARALGGEVVGRQVLAPGPGHSRRDRSLSICSSAKATKPEPQTDPDLDDEIPPFY
jgi:hypothetical protein